MQSVYLKKCVKQELNLKDMVSDSTQATLLIFLRKHVKCLMMPVLKMLLYLHQVTLMNTLLIH